MAITKKQIFKTAVLPGIYPRLKSFFAGGFENLSYLIAVVYNMVRILPNNHRFLKTENKGTYSIRAVISEASNHINFSLKNIDQVIIFFTVIAAFFILLIQFLILIFSVIIPRARAADGMPTNITGFFNTPEPQQDLAFKMLDLVFGIPNIFGLTGNSENTVHEALHNLFEFYSYGMLVVGAIIIVYYVIAVVAETAQSGVPFGQRFNKAWAPIRVILFFALLIPFTSGINTAQYLTLYAAKLGSGLATTGWLAYNDKITTTLTGNVESNIAEPTPPNISYIPAFMLIAKTCEKAYHWASFNTTEQPASHIPSPDGAESGRPSETGIKAWVVYNKKLSDGGGQAAELMSTTSFQNIAELSATSNFRVVFGVKDIASYPQKQAGVYPFCGSISFMITDIAEPGSATIHTAYYDLINKAWNDGSHNLDTFSKSFVTRHLLDKANRNSVAQLPDENYKKLWINEIDKFFNGSEAGGGIIKHAMNEQVEKGDWQLTGQIKDYGWAGAGIWYNKIALQNGALVSALQQAPVIVSYPDLMERNLQHIKIESEAIANMDPLPGGMTRYVPLLPERYPNEREILSTLQQVYLYWQGAEDQPDLSLTKNPIIDAVNVMLGTGGLFEMCKNTDVHPLAQLSSVGKTMIESAIRSFMAAGIFTIATVIPNPFSGAAQSFASMFASVATIGLLIGFILFYILPFMPFLYFFFAVGGWVKGIFEAMVAMPLWALAHLRIDGESIPGEAAIKGYYLIFEIFIRPILIVFGLLASITIFAAMVRVLNDIFYIAISNISGHEAENGISCFLSPEQDLGTTGTAESRAERANQIDDAKRGPIDEFFFTILYAIVVYMVGTTCFKLIDMIPNDILRWFNAEIPSFNDKTDDVSEGLVKYIALAGERFGGSLSSSIGGVGPGVQGSVNQAMGLLK